MASFSQTTADESLLVSAIQKLTNEVRETLGETLADIKTSTASLEKVTTPSLRALQLYSQADALFIEFKSQAHQLLLQAVELDPDFASAHVLLGYVYRDFGQKEKSAFHFQRAMDLADNTSDRERYFIISSYYRLHEFDQAKAFNVLELLMRKYPDHYWANSNLEWIHHEQGQPLRALPYTVRRADLRPNNFYSQLVAARRLLIAGRDLEYRRILERATRLANRDWQKMQLRVLDIHLSWQKGDIAETYTKAKVLYREAFDDSSNFNFTAAWQAVNIYVALGRLTDAQSLISKFGVKSELGALFNFELGNMPALETYLANIKASHRKAILLTHLGETEQAKTMLEDPAIRYEISAPFHLPTWEGLAYGELAMAQGQHQEAVKQLRIPFETPPMWPTAYYFLGLDSMADALEELGDIEQAIKTLEHSNLQRQESIFWEVATMFWMNNKLRLAEIYDQTGKLEKAEEIKTELRALLSVADLDHPILLKLNSKL